MNKFFGGYNMSTIEEEMRNFGYHPIQFQGFILDKTKEIYYMVLAEKYEEPSTDTMRPFKGL